MIICALFDYSHTYLNLILTLAGSYVGVNVAWILKQQTKFDTSLLMFTNVSNCYYCLRMTFGNTWTTSKIDQWSTNMSADLWRKYSSSYICSRTGSKKHLAKLPHYPIPGSQNHLHVPPSPGYHRHGLQDGISNSPPTLSSSLSDADSQLR